MVQRLCNHAAVLIVGIFVGMVVANWSFDLSGPEFFGRGVSVHATATQGQDNSAIATGLVDNGIEAFYFLDTLTGDLRAAVVNRRNREFAALFEYNVLQDFGMGTKNPKYLMVTGLADLPRGRGATQFGKSLIYVCEATSGQVNAYALPWNPSLNAAGKVQRGTFQRVAGGPFRTTFVRDQ